MSGTGRLPSLNQPNGKTGLKFKPKVLARRSKEEREASVPKTAPEEVGRGRNDDGKHKYSKRNIGNNMQRRTPRYLNNTHVINSGPFAAGNFSGGGGDMRRGFIKSEGNQANLLKEGLKEVGDDSDGENATKINMGKEYRKNRADDSDIDSDHEDDAAALQSKQLASLFPVRATRVRHEDVEAVKKELQESMSDAATREPTPGVPKLEDEEEDRQNSVKAALQSILKGNDTELQRKLDGLKLQGEFHSVNSHEAEQEVHLLNEDHKHITRKLVRLNNKPNKFLLFQLPSVLPEFEAEMIPEASGTAVATASETSAMDEKPVEKPSKITKLEQEQNKPNPVTGNIGSLRVHKSGRLSVKVGNVVMDISRGAEASFLQQLVALDDREEERAVECLGRIDGKVVVTPQF
ncbi:LAMI_0E15280g1_1 [Lachancea mirantina]|uniref:LAMI_0E15280g1_1 n=1 Tax=Lachancea mirantina TaxID=1230905 RepID=A0A1G4JS55_9SACH|nr:LAMI_0E15280g1_1 [Lachancea mirantina]